MSDTRLYLFGPPRLEYQGQSVNIDTRKALALLAYLLIEGKPQSRDTLAALLWPESDQTAARGALRRTLSPLRTALSDNLADFGREIITLHPESGLWCDVLTFQNALNECRTHGHPKDQSCPRCLPSHEMAADLYRGDFMAGFSLRDSTAFDDWQFFETDRLRRELAGVLEQLVTIYQEKGDSPAAIDQARRWFNLDPLNETAHRALISLYAQSGQRNAALRQYRECVRILDQELGVPPLDETTRLYEAVKENRLERQVVSEQLPVTSSMDTMQPKNDNRSLITDHPPLVGRAPEWEKLTRIYEGLRQNGAFAALTGEAGIGKTYLAQEFITHLQSRGVPTLIARGYAGESNLAYSPLIDLLRQGINQSEGTPWWQGLHPRWLSEVVLLIPELSAIIPDLPTPLPTEGPGAQSRFFEGVCQTLTALVSGPSPGVIFIDNLERADESTLDLLAYLARRLQGRSVFLLVSWQMENLSNTRVLQQMLKDTEQQGYGFHLPLSVLPPDQSLAMVEQLEISEQPFAPAFKHQLVQASQGLPIFLVEYLQAALQGEIRSDSTADQWPVPIGLRAMLQARLANLSAVTYQTLQAAAVIGRSFESELLQSVSGRTVDEAILGIEELIAQNLIRELPIQAALNPSAARYDFKQEQIRAMVLEEISLIRLRLLHRRTAEAMVEQTRLQGTRNQSGQIAYHYQQAGLTEQAAEYYFLAGELARAIHANADALIHFQTALALGYPKKSNVLVELGDLHTLNGDYPQAVQQYEAAAAFSDPALLPVIEQKLGRVYFRRGSWEQAACHFEAALYDLEVLLPEERTAFEAKVRADWSLACHREGKTEQTMPLAQVALDLAESSQDSLALAQVHNLLGILFRADQHPDLASEHLRKSLVFARQLENPSAEIAALNNLALAQADQDEYPQAIATLESALEACQDLGDRHLEAAIRNNLADLLRVSGQENVAMMQLKQAVTIFGEIGQSVNDWEPEIWKLTEW